MMDIFQIVFFLKRVQGDHTHIHVCASTHRERVREREEEREKNNRRYGLFHSVFLVVTIFAGDHQFSFSLKKEVYS